jgi:hypothetical protein
MTDGVSDTKGTECDHTSASCQIDVERNAGEHRPEVIRALLNQDRPSRSVSSSRPMKGKPETNDSFLPNSAIPELPALAAEIGKMPLQKARRLEEALSDRC